MTDIKAEDLSLLSAAGKELYRLHEKVTAMMPLTEESAGSGLFDCPMCGEGTIDADYVKNFDTSKAAGIQIYGIGEALTDLKAYVKSVVNLLPELLLEMAGDKRRLAHMERWLREIIRSAPGTAVGDLAEAALTPDSTGKEKA